MKYRKRLVCAIFLALSAGLWVGLSCRDRGMVSDTRQDSKLVAYDRYADYGKVYTTMNYLGSNAGTTAANGLYEQAGTHNGKPYYEFINGINHYYLFFNNLMPPDGGWCVHFLLEDFDYSLPDGLYWTTYIGATPLTGIAYTPSNGQSPGIQFTESAPPAVTFIPKMITFD